MKTGGIDVSYGLFKWNLHGQLSLLNNGT